LGWIAATPNGRIYLFFFCSPEKLPEGGGVRSLEVGGGLFIWLVDLFIGCFDFISNLCIFPKLLGCQLMNGGQKTPPFYHNRMATAP
jgi:hypothetical protein